MKKIICVIVMFLMIFSAGIAAAKTWTCYYPEWIKIIGSEFSTGGGDKMLVVFEVGGIDQKTGEYVKYITTIG
jgi:hypothetical protein